MINPFEKLNDWIQEEDNAGNPFSKGAVLSTVSKNRTPRSRVLGTMLDGEIIKFHTSPASRKFEDIEFCKSVSLTYSFQRSLRSVSIEGTLVPLGENELNIDWMKFDSDFRKHYLIFGGDSGSVIEGHELLKKKFSHLVDGEENTRPDSFVGFKFSEIMRISFYSVVNNDFSSSVLFERKSSTSTWVETIVMP
ncbi:MAG: pyridoxamine 5'-phosphate oxidase family protein [Thiomicrorhabdus sp.]|nr:pyridoxamine 5'-phosphate oxidase family protein [Thiomicrorhabdus sp.]